jgi:hypothetical protein
VGSIQRTSNGRYRARYRDSSGKEHLKRFALKRDAQRWLDQETTKRETGTWVSPRTARVTVGEWCEQWLRNYATQKPSTVRQAKVHLRLIVEEFGSRKLEYPSVGGEGMVGAPQGGRLCPQLCLGTSQATESDL